MFFMFFFIIEYFFLLILIFISIAFFTLMERKILAIGQNRKSLNKNFFFGIFTPLFDGLKLLKKENLMNKKTMKFLFFIGPMLMFLIMIIFNISLFFFFNFLNFKFYFFFLLFMFGFNIYSIMFSGWMSFCKYSMISHIRSGNQTITYEIILSILVIIFFFFFQEMNKENIFNLNIFFNLFLMFNFFLTMIVELNRTPFDFSESESELISGFNTEFSSILFVLMFLGEYGMIIFSSFMMSFFFLKMNIFLFSFFLVLFIIIRASFPRWRYDMMMNFFWKSFFLIFILIFFLFLLFF